MVANSNRPEGIGETGKEGKKENQSRNQGEVSHRPVTANGFKPGEETDIQLLLRTYYTSVIALRTLPPELIIHICRLADFVSPRPDPQASSSYQHKPSRYQKTVFRTSEARKIVPWFRTPALSHTTLRTAQRIEFHVCSHGSYPASRSFSAYTFYANSLSTTQRRVPWRNFSLRLVSPTRPKQVKTRWDDSPLSWPCFEDSTLPPDAEPQPSDPGVVVLDRKHELWEWAEVGDWVEVTVRAHYSWELASFKLDGSLRVFNWWEPSTDMMRLIQKRTE